MNDEELAQLDAGLRALASSLELDWVLTEVDRSIAEGFPEERIVRRVPINTSNNESWRQFDSHYLERPPASAERKSNREKPVIVVRPMSRTEQVRQLVVALRVLLVEGPRAESILFKNLIGGEGGEQLEVSFAEENPRGFGEPNIRSLLADSDTLLNVDQLTSLFDQLLTLIDDPQ